MSIDYRIHPLKDYTPQIGTLVSMLDHTRDVTLSEIKDLTQQELDQRPSSFENSTGALLQHIAGIEKAHQLITFERRDFTKEEWEVWEPTLVLGEKGKEIHGNTIDYYINLLSSIREKTKQELQQKPDQWLWEEFKWPHGVAYNYHFMWYHVMEDELSHRGQIRLLKKALKK
ncbi:DinB family protein [Pontibacillus marinus]|uniref:DinB-like domain-containing protein n=1 Tax=Pontibacillus marinus BH030004 = DSM 16465 TaxID=1385511 RepID=A0A0A5FWF6_9BACI|nr:DUF664 domain-containing protein [Pontibacillus marinus]KGX84264.1 hypothetical protein N783_18000 [Pontibacillus marinus BH030004 = DSM 16465]